MNDIQNRNMKTLVALSICLISFSATFGQNTRLIDSLETKLPSLKGVDKTNALYELVYFYLRSDLAKARHYAEVTQAYIKNESDENTLAYGLMAVGIYKNRSGNFDSATFLLEEAKKFGISSKNDRALIRIYASLGHSSIASGKPGKGLAYLFDALHVLDRYPEAEMEMKIRTNIPWAYLELKQYRNCIHYGHQTLSFLAGTDREWIALYTYNNMAVSYGALGILDSAKYFIGKGILAAEKSQDNQSLANAYFILGGIYSDAGKYNLAIEQYMKARPYREKVGNPFFLISDLYAISDLHHKSGSYAKGIQSGKEALKLAEQFNMLLKFEGTYLSLAKNYDGLKDYQNSAKYYSLYAAAKDSVYKNSSSEAIAEMQTRYETEKKEQQLALQHSTLASQRVHITRTYIIIGALVLTIILVTIIFILLRSRTKRNHEMLERARELITRDGQIQASIQSQETERKRFAQDLHDGMGQLISALRLALQRVNKESTLEQRIEVVAKGENILNEMYREIRSIAFNLMPQTLVQDGLVPALKEMSNRINGSGKIVVRVSSFDMPARLTELNEISMYRIIQEWVNNVIKYADASLIQIQLVKHEDEICLTIEDDGKGFDVSILKNSSGNGWKNIKSRLNLVKGSMDIDSRVEVVGTTLIIRIPESITQPSLLTK